jgi:hypothetical protein
MSEAELRARFEGKAVDVLMSKLRPGGPPEIDPSILAADLAGAGARADAGSLLDAAATLGLLERKAAFRCPVPRCGRPMDEDAVAALHCPRCDTDLRELGEEPVAGAIYRTGVRPSRDIPWFIAVHGMNTRAPWQEEFSWRVANKLKYHAPVLIYKYGLIRFSVLVRWRHRALARQLGNRIRKGVAHARANGIVEPPDVLIHSFGSQLFRLVLEADEFRDLRFGRVVSAGSIIAPNFDWTRMMDAGRIDGVLNHCAGRDRAVPLAQFFIPGTGPAGRHGFCSAAATNLCSPALGHSGVLSEDVLATHLAEGGAWHRFLTDPGGSFADPSAFVAERWAPVPKLLRGLVRAGGLLLGLIIAFLLAGLLVWLCAGIAGHSFGAGVST